jgi:hypothetical protein
MHLASAAFRIPEAMLKAIEARPGKTSAFDSLCQRISTDLNGQALPTPVPVEWPRALLEPIRIHAPIACCELTPSGTAGAAVTSDSIALAVVVALRDDFAHGETGLSEADRVKKRPDLRNWLEHREAWLSSLYRCQIVAAQQRLIDWSLNHL